MTKTTQILSTGVLLLPVCFSGYSNTSGTILIKDTGKKPNIVFIFADDQRFNTIHALGNDEIITPNLDKLVEKGTSFTNAYIMGGTSPAVCMPSRAMLVTGRYLFNLEKQGKEIPENHEILGETLQMAGYNTFGTGKWHNGRKSFARSFNAGDNIFFGGMCDPWNVPANHYDPGGKYDKKVPFIENPFSSNKVEYRQCEFVADGSHAIDLFSEAAENYIQNYSSDKPFFMYVSYTSPHDPRSTYNKYRSMYDTANISIPPNFLPEHPFDNGEMRIRDEKLAGFPRTKSEVKIHIRDYYAMITHLDEKIGEIMEELDKKGELENTVFIFSGDNGLALGQHGLMGKQNVYEHSVKVPLIFSGKNIPKGKTNPAFCYLLDIYPTICEMLDLPIPASVNGKSFWQCVEIGQPAHREFMYFGYRDLHRALRQNEFKIIEYKINDERYTQLFNLKEDPYEMNNLSTDEKYVEKLKELRQVMKSENTYLNDTIALWIRDL